MPLRGRFLYEYLEACAIYQSDVCFTPAKTGAVKTAPLLIVHESRTGYHLMGCPPAEPASVSPGANIFAVKAFSRSRDFQRTATCVLTVCASRGDKRKSY
jgi:hypothetical protein